VTLRGELPDFRQAVSLAVFRIIQEALRNVEKHASADNVEIAISCFSQAVEIVISDDGVGFDPRSRDSGGSMGLRGMKERAVLIQGRLEVESAPRGGTSVQLTFPVQPQEVQHVGRA
jgi:signal transduction histidine kinase